MDKWLKKAYPLVDWGAGRKPEAGCCPGLGWMAGVGPIRGLKGGLAGGGGALGLTEVMNWAFVRFRHVLNSTVDPRYWEHLYLIFSFMGQRASDRLEHTGHPA